MFLDIFHIPLLFSYTVVGKGLYTKCLRTRPNHIKVDCSHETSGYRRSTDTEVPEATYNCKIGFIEVSVFNIIFDVNNYLVF